MILPPPSCFCQLPGLQYFSCTDLVFLIFHFIRVLTLIYWEFSLLIINSFFLVYYFSVWTKLLHTRFTWRLKSLLEKSNWILGGKLLWFQLNTFYYHACFLLRLLLIKYLFICTIFAYAHTFVCVCVYTTCPNHHNIHLHMLFIKTLYPLCQILWLFLYKSL